MSCALVIIPALPKKFGELGHSAVQEVDNIHSHNLWTKMTKVKLLSWSSSAKNSRQKAGYEVLTLKASFSLMISKVNVATDKSYKFMDQQTDVFRISFELDAVEMESITPERNKNAFNVSWRQAMQKQTRYV